MNKRKPRILTGDRPTGPLHLGHFVGTLQNRVKLQDKYDCFFIIADLHTLTTAPTKDKTSTINDRARGLVLDYLSVGIDPDKSVIYQQSQVPEVTYLSLIFTNLISVPRAQRVPTLKEVMHDLRIQKPSLGLLNYPVLQSADILMVKANLVPVGKDQEQHVEFARMIAKKFNKKFGETFCIPKALISKNGARIMSLQDPKKKMSKTGSAKGCIDLFEKPGIIRKKIMSAVTDTDNKIVFRPNKKNGISNLLTIYSLISDREIKDIEKQFENKKYSEFKKSLGDELVKKLKPFRENREKLLSREVYIEEILKNGEEKARRIAQSTMRDVKEKMGF